MESAIIHRILVACTRAGRGRPAQAGGLPHIGRCPQARAPALTSKYKRLDVPKPIFNTLPSPALSPGWTGLLVRALAFRRGFDRRRETVNAGGTGSLLRRILLRFLPGHSGARGQLPGLRGGQLDRGRAYRPIRASHLRRRLGTQRGALFVLLIVAPNE